MKAQVRAALVVFGLLTVVTAIVYPLLITFIAQGVFSHRANGSVVVRDGKAVGSELIGQPFNDPRYFWGRPSATTPAYDGGNSSGSHPRPTNPGLGEAGQEGGA